MDRSMGYGGLSFESVIINLCLVLLIVGGLHYVGQGMTMQQISGAVQSDRLVTAFNYVFSWILNIIFPY